MRRRAFSGLMGLAGAGVACGSLRSLRQPDIFDLLMQRHEVVSGIGTSPITYYVYVASEFGDKRLMAMRAISMAMHGCLSAREDRAIYDGKGTPVYLSSDGDLMVVDLERLKLYSVVSSPFPCAPLPDGIHVSRNMTDNCHDVRMYTIHVSLAPDAGKIVKKG